MFSSFRYLSRQYFAEFYPNLGALLAEVIGVAGTLVVYWYTAQAFGKFWSETGAGYFPYVVTGEAVLALPLALFTGVGRALRGSVIDGTFEPILLSPRPAWLQFALAGLALLPREAARLALLLLLAQCFFGLFGSGTSWGVLISLQLLSLPLFWGLGLAGAALYLIFGRGVSMLGQVGTVLAILAGVYFPTSVFPGFLQKASFLLSPFTTLLETSRSLLGQRNIDVSVFKAFCLIAGWDILCVTAGVLIFGLALAVLKRKGSLCANYF